MRLKGPRLILNTLARKTRETLDLLLHEAGGDLRGAWELWEAAKDQRASLSNKLTIGGTVENSVTSQPTIPNAVTTGPRPEVPSLPPRETATLQPLEVGGLPSTASTEFQQVTVPCPDLAKCPRILDRFRQEIQRCGVVGEDRAAQLIYLAITSRFLDRPVSVVLKGPSGAGKNYVPEQTLRFFPTSATYVLSAMSEKALAYSKEPLSHRIIVIYEAAGVSGEFATYLLRSLLSEGRIRYETVESTRDGLNPKFLTREGPTGLLISTTAIGLHPENETRMLSIPISDSPGQTQRVLRAIARESDQTLDLSEWVAFQGWLEQAEHRVTIPFAEALADLVPPVAVRLRRDFKTLLNLIRSHAILHQASRERDREGRIIANLEDYGIVRELMADFIAEAVELSVPESIRSTVTAVGDILKSKVHQQEASLIEVARHLKIDKSSAFRRVKAAISRGYLLNLESRRGRPYRLVLGEPLPEEQELLPHPDALKGCTVAVKAEGEGGEGDE